MTRTKEDRIIRELVEHLRSAEPMDPYKRAWLADALDPNTRSKYRLKLVRQPGNPNAELDRLNADMERLRIGRRVREHLQTCIIDKNGKVQPPPPFESAVAAVMKETGKARSTIIAAYRRYKSGPT